MTGIVNYLFHWANLRIHIASTLGIFVPLAIRPEIGGAVLGALPTRLLQIAALAARAFRACPASHPFISENFALIFATNKKRS